MDRLIFNQTGGFPLTTDILNALQNAYNVFNAMSGLSGNLAILSGCETQGNNVSDGVVVIGNEVFAFKGGIISDKVIIKEETESKLFEDGSSKSVIIRKTATFGNGATTYNWADFKRIKNLLQFDNEIFKEENSVEKRLKKLEERVTKTIPIGLVAVWGKPATEPIPDGWRECTDLRGRFPLGWNPNDMDFNTLGKIGGEKSHTLAIRELPKHSHKTIANVEGSGWGVGQGAYASQRVTHGGAQNYNITGTNSTPNVYASESVGDGQAHNNMPPYRVIKFIEFVGFN